MNKLTIGDIADFTWDFGQCFFLETAKGNYVWSSPDYGGDNTIRLYKGSIKDYFTNGTYGRSKGKHFIENYCGSNVVIE